MSVMAQRPVRDVALLFGGQGTQHPRMAAGLYGHEETFTHWMDRAFELFGPEGPRLRSEWLAERPSPLFDDVSVAQPLLYTVGHALGRMVLGWGVRPRALLGHSVGELAAATLAGVLDLADGVRLMSERAGTFAGGPPGGMLAVAAPAEELADVLGDGVHLAARNAARQVLLSGERGALERAERILSGRGVTCRAVRAHQAFHSPLVASAVEASLPGWRAVRLRPPRLAIYSCYTGRPLGGDEARDPAFWAGQAAATVDFAAALSALLADGDRLLVEAGAGNSLTVLARRHPAVASGGSAVLPLLPERRSGDEADRRAVEAARRRLLAPAPPARAVAAGGAGGSDA